MQQFFKAWDKTDAGVYAHTATSVIDVAFLRRLQAELGDDLIGDEALRQRLAVNYALLERFARTWQTLAIEQAPALRRIAPAPSREQSELLDVLPLRLTMTASRP
jgi:hypothetical protein